MSETIEVEIDDVHKLMFTQLQENMDEEKELGEWASEALHTIIYQAHQNQ